MGLASFNRMRKQEELKKIEKEKNKKPGKSKPSKKEGE